MLPRFLSHFSHHFEENSTDTVIVFSPNDTTAI